MDKLAYNPPFVALRKESVDRNVQLALKMMKNTEVALRKESVDRNTMRRDFKSLGLVALRKESVDRNVPFDVIRPAIDVSLSARRAWIEMPVLVFTNFLLVSRSPQGERG